MDNSNTPKPTPPQQQFNQQPVAQPQPAPIVPDQGQPAVTVGPSAPQTEQPAPSLPVQTAASAGTVQAQPSMPASPTQVVASPTMGTAPEATGAITTHVLGRRFGAIVLDTILGVALFSLMAKLFGKQSVGGGSVNFSLSGPPYLAYVLLVFLYFVLTESFAGGTLGKKALGIKVVNEQNANPSFGRAFARNLLRIIDGFPYIVPYLLGWIVAVSKEDRKRIGDTVAKTSVVKDDNAKSKPKAWLILIGLVVVLFAASFVA